VETPASIRGGAVLSLDKGRVREGFPKS